MRAAHHRAAARGGNWKAVQSSGELHLGSVRADGTIGSWKKFADNGVLITAEFGDDASKALAATPAGVQIDGVGQATALFEFKAEKGISDIPNQQERALGRMVNRWSRGEPVYVALGVVDDSGAVTTKVYLLQPPDSKGGLNYFGVGTSNAFIAEREQIVQQGVEVKNMLVDLSNDEARAVWQGLFWSAFEALP
jgi:hypothetical protein